MIILEVLLDFIVDLFMLSVPRQARLGCYILMLLALVALFVQ